ncbi:RecX family transcriptional regulator [Labilibaculum sp. DW002]|uniref:Regulatory protein RecX n=1 Tax=Paralabilibaculum antarcticum TaxID=2912572 RepID=A0ABT5VSL2_9BACT|nr:regulatory protein RecX [Labilibaculum sp. DW002]MDE5418417.1 RecX family transcriptional regulator [Labilibaculum sp. DW002]
MDYEKKQKKEISAQSALSKVMFICSRQEKCCFDIRKKLHDWNLSYDDQDEIIQTLIEEKFLNEERYTNFYVRDKFRFNKWGKIKISHHLKQKQIPENLIDNALDQINEKDYKESLGDILSHKIKSIKEDDPYQLRAKLYRFAQGRGFESHIALNFIDKLISELE